MKNLKTFIIGLVTGVILVSAPVVADTIMKSIDVEENLVTIYVDGQKVEESNFLYNGRTFAPLREIAEKLGFEVQWDGATNSAYIGKLPEGVVIGQEPSVTRSNVFSGEVIGDFNGEPIYADELLAYTNAISVDEAYADEDITEIAKKNLLENRALEKFAKETGFAKEDMYADEFSKWYENATRQYGDDGVEKLFAESGYTKDTYRYFYYLYLLRSKVMDSINAIYYPSDAQIQEYYDAHKEGYKYDGLRAKHVLIKTVDDNNKPLSDAEIKKAEKTANEVYKKAITGTDFDTLVNKYGQDPGAEYYPEGYTFTRGDMVEEFENAAYELKVGEISKPVKSAYGYHVIKLEEEIPYLTLDDVSVKEYIINLLQYDNFIAQIEAEVEKTPHSFN